MCGLCKKKAICKKKKSKPQSSLLLFCHPLLWTCNNPWSNKVFHILPLIFFSFYFTLSFFFKPLSLSLSFSLFLLNYSTVKKKSFSRTKKDDTILHSTKTKKQKNKYSMCDHYHLFIILFLITT